MQKKPTYNELCIIAYSKGINLIQRFGSESNELKEFLNNPEKEANKIYKEINGDLSLLNEWIIKPSSI